MQTPFSRQGWLIKGHQGSEEITLMSTTHNRCSKLGLRLLLFSCCYYTYSFLFPSMLSLVFMNHSAAYWCSIKHPHSIHHPRTAMPVGIQDWYQANLSSSPNVLSSFILPPPNCYCQPKHSWSTLEVAAPAPTELPLRKLFSHRKHSQLPCPTSWNQLKLLPDSPALVFQTLFMPFAFATGWALAKLVKKERLTT